LFDRRSLVGWTRLDPGAFVDALNREAVELFAVGNPAGLRHEAVLFPDPFLNLLVGGRLTYHNVLYDTSMIEGVKDIHNQPERTWPLRIHLGGPRKFR
jgi:hypothetical protein